MTSAARSDAAPLAPESVPHFIGIRRGFSYGRRCDDSHRRFKAFPVSPLRSRYPDNPNMPGADSSLTTSDSTSFGPDGLRWKRVSALRSFMNSRETSLMISSSAWTLGTSVRFC